MNEKTRPCQRVRRAEVYAFDANGELRVVAKSGAIIRGFVSTWLATGERREQNAYFLNAQAYEHCIARWNTEPGWKFEALAGGAS